METKFLTKNQTAFLAEISRNDFLVNNFYLTGGTALSAFYLHHRYSEDLDFFSEKEIDTVALNVYLKGVKDNLNISKIDFQQSYNRNLFFLDFGGEVLKTEFTFFPFPRIEKGKRENGIELDSVLDIAVNKLFTIYQRTQARDYLDLYFICKEKGFLISELIKKARAKFDWHIDPIQLGAQFVKAREVKDYPRMIKEVNNQEWQGFFISEAEKLKEDIFTEK